MPIAAVIGYLVAGNNFNVFNSGFLAGGIVWLGLSFKLDMETNSIMTNKMVELMPVNDSITLLLISGIIGAFIVAFAAATGSSFRNIYKKKVVKSLYS